MIIGVNNDVSIADGKVSLASGEVDQCYIALLAYTAAGQKLYRLMQYIISSFSALTLLAG